MLLHSWLGFLRPRSRRGPVVRRRTTRPSRARLHVEPLEDRCLLASSLSASLVADIDPGYLSSRPTDLTNVNGSLYFAAGNGSTYGLFKSDGTAAGTMLVKGKLYPVDITPMSGSVFFSSD